jgi:hypothetical protein
MRLRKPCRLFPPVFRFYRENLPSRPPSAQHSLSIFRRDAVLAIRLGFESSKKWCPLKSGITPILLNCAMKQDRGPARLRRTRADQVASWYGQSVERNAICLEKFAPSTNVEEYRSVRPEHGFHSAALAMMARWWFTGLGILHEMMALEVRYHGDSSLLDARAPN